MAPDAPAMLMMRPVPSRGTSGRNSRIMRKAPTDLICTWPIQSLSSQVISRSCRRMAAPALLTRMFALPKCSRTAAAAACMEAVSVTSASTGKVRTPNVVAISSAAAASASRPRAISAMSTPSAAMARATPLPTPLLAPVMTATRPFKLSSICLAPCLCCVAVMAIAMTGLAQAQAGSASRPTPASAMRRPAASTH
ncbi:hypothetical protein D3C81_1622250 [compost metagenome]